MGNMLRLGGIYPLALLRRSGAVQPRGYICLIKAKNQQPAECTQQAQSNPCQLAFQAIAIKRIVGLLRTFRCLYSVSVIMIFRIIFIYRQRITTFLPGIIHCSLLRQVRVGVANRAAVLVP